MDGLLLCLMDSCCVLMDSCCVTQHPTFLSGCVDWGECATPMESTSPRMDTGTWQHAPWGAWTRYSQNPKRKRVRLLTFGRALEVEVVPHCHGILLATQAGSVAASRGRAQGDERGAAHWATDPGGFICTENGKTVVNCPFRTFFFLLQLFSVK